MKNQVQVTCVIAARYEGDLLNFYLEGKDQPHMPGDPLLVSVSARAVRLDKDGVLETALLDFLNDWLERQARRLSIVPQPVQAPANPFPDAPEVES